MSVFRAKTIKQIKANQIASDFTSWCNSNSDCMYKNKKRKFHGWLNLSNLSKKNKVAQCGWDDGDCNHTINGKIDHNICPIAGFNGDYPWPAKLQFSNFSFEKNGITSTAKITEVHVHLEHRMVAIDTVSGIIYDNFGPTFHNKSGGWGCKVYFTNGDNIISKVNKYTGNPKLSKKNYSPINYKFTDITVSELLNNNFALNIEYNHNYNTNPGIIYLKNVYIEVLYEDAKIYINGSADKSSLYTSQESGCYTEIQHTINAGYKNGSGTISPSKAPEKLGSKIQCLKKPKGVTVTQISSGDVQKKFKITDKSNTKGKKTVEYNLSNHVNETVSLTYTAEVRPKPSYNFSTEYKSNEDYDANKSYIVFKNGCASKIYIYIDSIDSTPLSLNVSNQNSTINLLNDTEIKKYHDKIKTLSCGNHTLYIRRGDSESLTDTQKNKVTITIKPMNFMFEIYTDENSNHKLEFAQRKNSLDNASTGTNSRYATIKIKRIDNEPQLSIPILQITDETQPSEVTTKTSIKKGDIINYQIDKYYSGDFYISIRDLNPCNKNITRAKITIKSSHKQNYDYLFTRGEKGTAFDLDYLVAWEGDNIKEPLLIDNVSLEHSINDIRICSDSAQSGLSQIGLVELKIKNTTNKNIEGIEIELNTLVKNENDEKQVTTSEWTEADGIFNQFYNLFEEYNVLLGKNVEVLNLTQDNDLVDEENVYLFINKIEALDTITIYLPFRSTEEKTVYLQYLLFEEPLKINAISNCTGLTTPTDAPTDIEINVYDSMLTRLEISGNTDLLVLDNSYDCPTECYTTKETNDRYEPIGNVQSGGITYKITNIDTNDFDEEQTSTTEILNSNELKPYGYIIDGEYHALLDNNDNIIPAQNNKLKWVQEAILTNQPMASQNIVCHVQFPNNEEVVYTVKTNKNGLAEFFIPIPTTLNTKYTIDELLENVLYFVSEEKKEYNKAVLTKKANATYDISDPDKNNVIITLGNNYRRYNPGEIAYIPIFLSANIKTIKNYFIFSAKLGQSGQSDQVTILYKACNLKNNEGIFNTTFKTNDKKLIQNEISKNIYCGIDTNIKSNIKIDKRILESTNLNILYIDIINQEKENKNVEIDINLGKIPLHYLGKYNFIDIEIEKGDYSIIEDENKYTHVKWLIGSMDSFEKQTGIIKIQAKDIGLSNIQVNISDYLKGIEVKKSKCEKCNQDSTWQIADSSWKKFNGTWYKLFPNGKYKKPVKVIIENGKYKHQWVDKE